MEEAIAFCRLVMKKSGQVNFRNDLEWIVKIAGRSAVVLLLTRMYLHSALHFVELDLCDFLKVELFYSKKILAGWS